MLDSLWGKTYKYTHITCRNRDDVSYRNYWSKTIYMSDANVQYQAWWYFSDQISVPKLDPCSLMYRLPEYTFGVEYLNHYSDVTMCAMASQITSLAIVYSAVYSGADQRKHQSSASLAFVRGFHRWPVNFPLKGPVTRKCFHLMTSSWCMIKLLGINWFIHLNLHSPSRCLGLYHITVFREIVFR